MYRIRLLKCLAILMVIFWCVWYWFVFASDAANMLQATWPNLHLGFNSQNLKLVAHSLAVYDHHPKVWSDAIFSVVVITSGFIAVCYSIGLYRFATKNGVQWVYMAFLLSIFQDMLFIVSDEFFLQYSLESGHMLRLGVKCITFIVFLKCKKQR